MVKADITIVGTGKTEEEALDSLIFQLQEAARLLQFESGYNLQDEVKYETVEEG